ncbi:olfactory receptor 52K2-like [Amia ocellicauda]|uniref:olfactory receptor 52K2-like n=1 Tax=Amia ocellicauda TaxID=2972642 RepID=UPI003464112E
MDNLSSEVSTVLTMEGLAIPPEGVYPAFILGMLSYCIILFCNLVIILTIALDKRLHEPMYLLLINLPINDLMGATAILPQLMKQILMDSRSISYLACVTQAFFVHMFLGGSALILIAMAYDRYVAICNPLRYSAIMTNVYLLKIITLIWVVDFTLMFILVALLLRFPLCRSIVSNVYCDNPSLVRLVCADTTLNNIYGLFIIVSVQVVFVSAVFYTYLQILLTCLKNKQSDAKSKAIQTCVSHLMVFIILELTGLMTLLSYRFEKASPQLRKVVGIFVIIFPPTMNPIIYGLKTKEIRNKIPMFFRRKVSAL